MAGRGVDIKLGGVPTDPAEEHRVKELGGLHVIGTDRHEARRIDNQLRGRSGRQGDPGSTQFYISMEDDLMRIFGSDRAKSMMDRLGIPDNMPIENKMITGAVEKAQTRVEGHHFDSRKHVLEYDDVLNKHREVIYGRRREVIDLFGDVPEKLRDRVLDIIEGEVEQVVLFHTGEFVDEKTGKAGSTWNVREIIETVQTIVPLTSDQISTMDTLTVEASRDKEDVAKGRTRVIEVMMNVIREQYDKVYQTFADQKEVHVVEKAVILRAIDMLWVDHLEAMSALRTGIGLRGYGQRDPLIEYKKEGFNMFQHLLGSINGEIVYTFFKYAHHAMDMKVRTELGQSLLNRAGVVLSGAQKGGSGGQVSKVEGRETVEKTGRNEQCPCGSGKKYKKCHGV
jgi:preprotein translocase subunit SecA